jgi:hypothetical protein
VTTSEPVVLHHGREAGPDGRDEARPTASTACWAAGDCGLEFAVEPGWFVSSVLESAAVRSREENGAREKAGRGAGA